MKGLSCSRKREIPNPSMQAAEEGRRGGADEALTD